MVIATKFFARQYNAITHPTTILKMRLQYIAPALSAFFGLWTLAQLLQRWDKSSTILFRIPVTALVAKKKSKRSEEAIAAFEPDNQQSRCKEYGARLTA
jgi:hypothetical protein